VTSPGLLADLVARGLVHDSTDAVELARRLDADPMRVYVGFDPTADSLHVGHLLGQITLRRMQIAGHRPVALAGGATGMVGDPSGRSEERNLLDADTLASNVASIKIQLERLLDFTPGPGAAALVDNVQWTAPMGALDFLRNVGKHVTVNQMLAKESVRSRMQSENGLSYTEFSYMLLQANDFRHLCATMDVEMQMGGSDQWGNITAGMDLIRRTLARPSYGLTWPLVTRSDGQKFGKTASGAVWLDPVKTSPFQFRQFWMQLSDDDVATLFPRFSLKPLSEISLLLADHRDAPEQRRAQSELADEMCTLVHGDAASRAAAEAARILFGADPLGATEEVLEVLAAEVPTARLSTGQTGDLFSALAETGVVGSTSEARRLVAQGAIRVNGEVVSDQDALKTLPLLHGRWLLVRRGKSSWALWSVTS
jgi:tyrosyl-tRNA synthetase